MADSATPATVPALLAVRAAADPDRVAVEVHGVGTLTFAAWLSRAERFAGGLRARGARPGDRIVLSFSARDWLDFAVAYIGTQLAGAVAVPCSDRLAPAELRHVLEHCGAAGLVTAATKPAGDTWVTTVADCDADPGDLPAPTPGALAQLLYTSGTTGRPKGVGATH